MADESYSRAHQALRRALQAPAAATTAGDVRASRGSRARRLAVARGRCVGRRDRRRRGSPGARRGQPDAILTADAQAWDAVADDLRGGTAPTSGRLQCATTSMSASASWRRPAANRPSRLGFDGAAARLSSVEAGVGQPLCLHGLGATKVSFLPTVAALKPALPGSRSTFPGSATPTSRSARATTPGTSPSGGRPPGRAGDRPRARDRQQPRRPDRVRARAPPPGPRRPPGPAGVRRWPGAQPAVGAAVPAQPPRARAVQLAPRPVVEAIVRRLIPGATTTGRCRRRRVPARVPDPARSAAFYAAARQIYLEEPQATRASGPG